MDTSTIIIWILALAMIGVPPTGGLPDAAHFTASAIVRPHVRRLLSRAPIRGSPGARRC